MYIAPLFTVVATLETAEAVAETAVGVVVVADGQLLPLSEGKAESIVA